MKILLILWAIGLAESDKLDGTYLPPRGSFAAGGYSEDLNLPLEFSKENLPSTLESVTHKNTDNLLGSKYPNIALGIDRTGPLATTSKIYTNLPDIIAPKNIYNFPTTSTYYDLTETATFPSQETYSYVTTVGPVTTISQDFPFISSSFDPNLNYDQYLIQQNMTSHKSPILILNSDSRVPILNLPNKSAGVLNDNFDLQTEKTKYPTPLYEENLDDTSKATTAAANSPYPDESHNQPTSDTQKIPVKLDSIIVDSQDFYDITKAGPSSSSVPGQTLIEKSVIMVSPISKSSIPTSSISSGTGYDRKFQPQTINTEDERNAVILNYKNEITPEGFAYSFDTSNGIHADESGTAINGVKAKGSYSFTGDDGKIYSIEYTADENGFLPRGDHLPTAPPIPIAILRGIEQNKKDKQSGMIDDGSYDDAKYGYRRYQGLMGRIPQNQYGIENILPTNNTKNDEALDKNSAGYAYSGSTKSPNIKKYPNLVNGDEELPKFNGANQPNGLFNYKDENVNNKLVKEPKTNFEENSPEKVFSKSGKESELFSPQGYNNNSPRQYSAQKEYSYDMGYEYTRPQNILKKIGESNLQSYFSDLRKKYELNPDDEKNNERFNSKDFIAQNMSRNFNNRNPITNSQILRKSFKDPITIPNDINSVQYINNAIIKPDISMIQGTGSSQFKNEDELGVKTEFSTTNPNYASSTLKSNNYPSSYTSYGKDKQFNNYYPSTPGSQYSKLTTPKPLEISSPFTPSTSSFSYSQITPSTATVTSTLKPLITSGLPISGITSRPPSYRRGMSALEQVLGSRFSPVKLNTFAQRPTEEPGYQGKLNKIPITKGGFSEDLEFLKPQNYRSQSSNKKVVGEDFSGPKQKQGFDSENGYYY